MGQKWQQIGKKLKDGNKKWTFSDRKRLIPKKNSEKLIF